MRRWATIRGVRGHARLCGSGPAVVLVHGLAVSGLYFVPLIRRLALSHVVLAPDLPGHGRAATPPRALTVPELADALLEWLDVVGLERPLLVGNSVGCQIAVDLAVRFPERAAGLVLVGPTMDPGAPTLGAQAVRLALDVVREPFALNVAELRDYARTGPRRIVATARLALADPVSEKLPRVPQRTLVVRGERDAIVSQEWAERVASLLPRGRVVVIPDAPHAAHWAAADAVARLVEELEQELRELPRPGDHRDMPDPWDDRQPRAR